MHLLYMRILNQLSYIHITTPYKYHTKDHGKYSSQWSRSIICAPCWQKYCLLKHVTYVKEQRQNHSKKRPYPARIPADYLSMESLSVDIKFLPKCLDNFKYLLVDT